MGCKSAIKAVREAGCWQPTAKCTPTHLPGVGSEKVSRLESLVASSEGLADTITVIKDRQEAECIAVTGCHGLRRVEAG